MASALRNIHHLLGLILAIGLAMQIHADCSLPDEDIVQLATANIDNDHKTSSNVRKTGIVGGPVNIPVDRDDVKSYVKKARQQFSRYSAGEKSPMVVETCSATSQVVSGIIYRILIKMGLSTCLKTEAFTDKCVLMEHSPIVDCSIIAYTKAWENCENIKITCEEWNTQIIMPTKTS